MAYQNVVVPKVSDRYESSIDEINHFQAEVSSFLAAGKDVKFVDADGNDAEVEQLHISTSGNIKSKTISQSDAEAVTMYFNRGEWHTQRMHVIFRTGTDTGLNIIVRFIQRVPSIVQM